MINNSDTEISVADEFLLNHEEAQLCQKYNVVGIIEVDRITDNEIQMVFDGYKRGTQAVFRLIGYYSFITEKFTWE